MTRAILLLLIVALFSCGRHAGNKGGANAENETGKSESGAAANFYKRYSGTIAGKAVVVHLVCYGGSLLGDYYYQSVGQDIALRNWNDTVQGDGVFALTEFAPESAENADGDRPTWDLRISGATAIGTWRSANGLLEYPINLTEDYPDGSTRLNAFRLADSAALQPGKAGSPLASASFSYLLPQGGEGDFLYNALKEQILPEVAHGTDLESGIKQSMAAYFAEYREENGQTKIDSGEQLEGFSLSYTSDNALYVHYNDDNWLVTEDFNSSFTGGMHGNYASSFANIDLAQKRIWHLTDIVADTAALRPLLNDAAIVYFKLKPGEDMEQRMLVDEVSPTGNVAVGARGLSFVYNPYEIASYADGQVTLYVPYKKLTQFLTPAFKARMKLREQAGVAMLSVLRRNKNQSYAGRRNPGSPSLSDRSVQSVADF